MATQLGQWRLWQVAGLMAAIGLLVTLALGAVVFRQLSVPLHRLAERMRAYSRDAAIHAASGPMPQPVDGDEVQAIAVAFAGLTQRIEAQAEHELQQVNAHREMMASVAHDLRTPLTALHGHLEALATRAPEQVEYRERVLSAALAQSDKLRRLSQQLFELAALQSTGQVLHRERFCLDELVTDTVQKFALGDSPPKVTLRGPPPGRLEFDGDLQLIERALTNLIDNAMRHAPGNAPVLIRVNRDGPLAQILVEDSGPGLPEELRHRLQHGQSLRDPPVKRTSGGIGGLGLAIAQRVAALHGGSLTPQPTRYGGTRLCLALPLAR